MPFVLRINRPVSSPGPRQVDELALDCSSADLDLQTTFNRLLTMSHTQFVENVCDSPRPSQASGSDEWSLAFDTLAGNPSFF